jgi:hypothetical protein
MSSSDSRPRSGARGFPTAAQIAGGMAALDQQLARMRDGGAWFREDSRKASEAAAERERRARRMEATLAAILVQLVAARSMAPSGSAGTEMAPVEKALGMLATDVAAGRVPGSLRSYARRVGCAPSTLSRKVREADGREVENAFRKVLRTARATTLRREAQETTFDPRTREAAVVDGRLPARSSHPGGGSADRDE